jgi:hypothetical protein
MRFKNYKIILAVLIAPLLVLWGCKGGSRPLSPVKVENITVSIPTAGLRPKASLLGTTTDLIDWTISGPLGSSPVTGSSTVYDSPVTSGVDTIVMNNVPIGQGEILSVELFDGGEDATSGEPLGIGATSLQLLGADTTVNVTLGSVSRSCYQVAVSQAAPYNWDDEEFNFEKYGFDYGEFNWDPCDYGGYPTGYLYENEDVNDVAFVAMNCGDGGYTYDLVDGYTGDNASIAYLGNGPLVNFDTVPTNFYADAENAKGQTGNGYNPIAAGEVYVVKLQGGNTPGYAWVQITDDGTNVVGNWINNDETNGYPSFIYRVNTSVPYYAAQSTTADAAARISDPDGTNGGDAAGVCSLTPDVAILADWDNDEDDVRKPAKIHKVKK